MDTSPSGKSGIIGEIKHNQRAGSQISGSAFLLPIDILDNREYNKDANTRYSRIGGGHVPRAKFQTLTEQMFYVLLCLKNECYGMDILDRVPAMTANRVSVGSGTLYNLLEQFLAEGFIQETKVEGRRRSYILTDKGREMLDKEYERIQAQAVDYRRIFGKEEAK